MGMNRLLLLRLLINMTLAALPNAKCYKTRNGSKNKKENQILIIVAVLKKMTPKLKEKSWTRKKSTSFAKSGEQPNSVFCSDKP